MSPGRLSPRATRSRSRRWLSIAWRAAAIQNSMSAPASSPRSAAKAVAISATVSACAASSASSAAMFSPVASVGRATGRELGKRSRRAGARVTVWVRRPSCNSVRRLTRQLERIRDPSEALRRRRCQNGPLPAGVGQRDQVAGEVAAVDSGDIARIQRTQIPRVVPVVEMPAERARLPMVASVAARRSAGFGGSQPGEIARASPPTADRGRDWSVRSGGPAPGSGLPGNCPAAACGRPPSRRSRRTARSVGRSAAAPGRRRRG